MTRHALIFGAALALLCGSVQAAHITDKLAAGLYPKPDASGQPLRLLVTGTPVEEIKHQGIFTQVRLADGATGWIQSEYLTDEKLAQVKLLELQAETAQVKQQLADAQARDAADKTRIAELEQAQHGHSAGGDETGRTLQAKLADAQAEIAALRTQAQASDRYQAEREARARSLEEQIRTLRNRIGRAALILGEAEARTAADKPSAGAPGLWERWCHWIFGLALLVSFAAGYKLFDYRLRRRYGRFRL